MLQTEQTLHSHVQDTPETSLQRRHCSSSRPSSARKLVECRICQEEDEDHNMESPCSCCGSLKYAHRKCVQRWCNEKGDITCEICLQQFSSGYSAPPKLFHCGASPQIPGREFASLLNVFRSSNELSRRDTLHFRTDHSFTDSSYDDNEDSNTRSVVCCRAFGVTFMVLLFFRHVHAIISGGDDDYSIMTFTVLLLRISGLLVPLYAISQALVALNHHRNQQQLLQQLPTETSEFEDRQSNPLPWNEETWMHLISIH